MTDPVCAGLHAVMLGLLGLLLKRQNGKGDK